MTREEAKEIFLNHGFIKVDHGDSVCTFFDGDKWREACIVISEWLKEEPTTKNDLPHCQHTDEEIAKSFVDDVEAVKDQLPTTKNNLGVDCISRQAVLELVADFSLSMGQVVRGIHALPTVTPQEPKSEWEQDHAILKAYSDGANEVIDKIRAEIEQTSETVDGFLMHDGTKRTVLEIIDKYKAESEEV